MKKGLLKIIHRDCALHTQISKHVHQKLYQAEKNTYSYNHLEGFDPAITGSARARVPAVLYAHCSKGTLALEDCPHTSGTVHSVDTAGGPHCEAVHYTEYIAHLSWRLWSETKRVRGREGEREGEGRERE